MKFVKTLTLIFLSLTVSFQSLAENKAKKAKTQTLNFDGMDVSSAKGTPRSSMTSTSEKSDFDYFFDTDVNFEKKVINSLESVR